MYGRLNSLLQKLVSVRRHVEIRLEFAYFFVLLCCVLLSYLCSVLNYFSLCEKVSKQPATALPPTEATSCSYIFALFGERGEWVVGNLITYLSFVFVFHFSRHFPFFNCVFLAGPISCYFFAAFLLMTVFFTGFCFLVMCSKEDRGAAGC